MSRGGGTAGVSGFGGVVTVRGVTVGASGVGGVGVVRGGTGGASGFGGAAAADSDRDRIPVTHTHTHIRTCIQQNSYTNTLNLVLLVLRPALSCRCNILFGHLLPRGQRPAVMNLLPLLVLVLTLRRSVPR